MKRRTWPVTLFTDGARKVGGFFLRLAVIGAITWMLWHGDNAHAAALFFFAWAIDFVTQENS